MHRFRLFPLLIVFTLVFAACTPQSPEEDELLLPSAVPVAPTVAPAGTNPTAPAGEPVVISFGALGDAHTRSIYDPLIKKFNQANPDVRVEFKSLDSIVIVNGMYGPETYNTEKIVRAVDVADTGFASEDDLRRGLILNLKPFIDADASFNRDDFYPVLLGEANTSVYRLPYGVTLPLYQYNRELWARSGVPTPTADWTWADFGMALDAIAQKQGETVETYGFVS